MGHIAVGGRRIGLVEDLGGDMRAAERHHRAVVVDSLAEDSLVEGNSAVGNSVADRSVEGSSAEHIVAGHNHEGDMKVVAAEADRMAAVAEGDIDHMEVVTGLKFSQFPVTNFENSDTGSMDSLP